MKSFRDALLRSTGLRSWLMPSDEVRAHVTLAAFASTIPIDLITAVHARNAIDVMERVVLKRRAAIWLGHAVDPAPMKWCRA